MIVKTFFDQDQIPYRPRFKDKPFNHSASQLVRFKGEVDRKHSDWFNLYIHLEIPACYQQAPIITNLSRCFGVEVNILTASLTNNLQTSGRFYLRLLGPLQKINQVLNYLFILNIKMSPCP